MPADAPEPSDAPVPSDARVPGSVHPTERQRGMRAALLGAALGAILAILSRRRSAGRG